MSKGVAKVRYAHTGVSCPAQIDATASLTGTSVSGKASVKVAAGKTTVISIPVKAATGEQDGDVQDRAEDERPPDDAEQRRHGGHVVVERHGGPDLGPPSLPRRHNCLGLVDCGSDDP